MDIDYSKQTYGMALDLLTEVDLTCLQRRANTARNRLREAILLIYPCGRLNFAEPSGFSAHRAFIDKVAAHGKMPACVDQMTEQQVADLHAELVQMARDITGEQEGA